MLQLTNLQLSIYQASQTGDLDELSKRWTEFIESQKEPVEWMDHMGMSPLHYACQKGRIGCAKFLCQVAHFDPNAQEEIGKYSPLHWAASNGHDSVVEYLVSQANCNPQLTTIYDETARDIAFRMKNESTVALFNRILGAPQERKTKDTVHRDVLARGNLDELFSNMSIGEDKKPRKKYESVLEFLESLELREYAQIFEQEAIDLELLKSGTITDMDLKDIGILKLGHRKKILNAVDLIA